MACLDKKYSTILPLIGEVNWLAMTQGRNDPSFNYALELEARLQAAVPEFTDALDSLRRTLDAVTGWHISWRQYVRGEVIGIAKQEIPIGDIEESTVIAHAVRGPAEYPLHEGWIVGSRVGIDEIMGGVGVWVEIGPDCNATRGIGFSMDVMHAIELTPPDHAA